MKNYLWAIGVMSMLISSCSQDEISETPPESQAIKVVNLVDGKILSADSMVSNGTTMALQFPSEAEFQRVMGEFSNMTPDEKIAFTDNVGFVSLEKLLLMADAELENIADNASSEAEFREKYSNYKDKYSKAFIFNSKQLDDLSVYIPASTNDLVAYLVGENHSVVIGNEVRTIDFSKEMRRGDALLYANNEPTTRALAGTNSFIVNNGSKKTIFRAELRYERLGVEGTPMVHRVYYHFGAQKKKWYGWKRDSDRNFAFTEKVNVSIGKYDRTYFYNCGGNYDISSGTSTAPNPHFVGTTFIWTDEMVEKDNKGNILFERPPLNAVICHENKAYECKIDLSI